MTAETTRFEDRLLAQLQDVVAHNHPPVAAPRVERRGRRAPYALALGGAAAAAVAATLIATGGDGSTAKAYDVQPGAGGEVAVTIRSLNDAAGLQRSLRDAGVPAVVCNGPVTAVAPPKDAVTSATGEHGTTAAGGDDGGPSLVTNGKAAAGAAGAGAGAGAPGTHAMSLSVRTGDDGSATFTVRRGEVPAGQQLVIATAQDGGRSAVAVSVGAGAC